MQPKPAQTKTYSFHFNRLTPTQTSNNFAFPKESVPSTYTPKNVNINFRYQSDGQQLQNNSISKNQCIKPSLKREKSIQGNKKYTFSLLLNQVQQQKMSQSNQQTHQKFSQNSNKQIVVENQRQKQKVAKQQNYSFKISNNNLKNTPTDKVYACELIKQRQAKILLQRQLKNQNNQNNTLKIQIKEFQNQVLQKDQQIQQLTNQIEELKRKTKENELNNLQYSGKSKDKDSAISSQTIASQMQENQQQFQKQVKEWSNSTIIYNYQEEYKQILAIFQVEIFEQNYHEHLLTQIDKLLKRVEQANRSITHSRQRQKQNCRLTHHIKKLQIQNVNLVNLMAFLRKQVEKANNLLEQANRQIQVCNIKRLNSKYHQQMAHQNQNS